MLNVPVPARSLPASPATTTATDGGKTAKTLGRNFQQDLQARLNLRGSGAPNAAANGSANAPTASDGAMSWAEMLLDAQRRAAATRASAPPSYASLTEAIRHTPPASTQAAIVPSYASLLDAVQHSKPANAGDEAPSYASLTEAIRHAGPPTEASRRLAALLAQKHAFA